MDQLDRRLLAGHIKTLRDACNESFGQFAERLGVPIREVSSYEIATRRPGYLPTKRLYETAVEFNQPQLAEYFKERMEALHDWLTTHRHYHEKLQSMRSKSSL